MEHDEIPPLENLDLVKNILAHTDEATRLSIRLTCDLFRNLGSDNQESPMVSAITQGYVELLPLLRKLKYPLPDDADELAAEHGQVEVLKYLYHHSFNVRMSYCYILAARYGHVKVLDWLYRHDQRINDYLVETAIQAGQVEVLIWARAHGLIVNANGETRKQFCSLAAEYGQLAVLKYFQSIGFTFDFDAIIRDVLTTSDSVEILEWLIEQSNIDNVVWRVKHNWVTDAVLHGNLKVSKWLHSHGVALPFDGCSLAARGNKLETLKWLHQQGLAFLSDTLLYAVNNGNSELIDWLLKHDCPRHADATLNAITTNKFHIFLLLVSYSYPYNYHECLRLAKPAIRQKLIEWRQY